jgi:spore maturation protein CgeB
VPIISDNWDGLESFFEFDTEILVARTSEDVLRMLRGISDADRKKIADRAREKVLFHHTAAHRAAELEEYILELISR